MFCPKCGRQMVHRDGHQYCEQGEMYLSQYVSGSLERAFFGGLRTSSSDDRNSTRISTKRPWFCPFDSSKLEGDEAPLVCPECHGILTGNMRCHLIERHPHRPDEF